MSRRVLLVISDWSSVRKQSAGLDAPRRDYLEIQRRLRADILDYESVEQSRTARWTRRLLGAPVAQAWLALRRRSAYDAIYSDGEHIGLPLGLLLGLCRHRPRHVSIGHLLDTPLKRLLLRLLRPQSGVDRFVVHSTVQRRSAAERLGFGPEQTALLPYHADPVFWNATSAPGLAREICAVGREYRDYGTLIAAVRSLDVKLTIAGGSLWSTHGAGSTQISLPNNVRVVQNLLTYAALRSMYRRTRIIVVPLLPVANQAGITTILEAMAMSRPVIVTANEGQRDVVRGRLVTAEGLGREAMGGPAAFGLNGALAEAETGLYVPPGDPTALRVAIEYLLNHPDEAQRMGAAGRRVVDAAMNIDMFCQRISEELSPDSSARPRAGAGQVQRLIYSNRAQ